MKRDGAWRVGVGVLAAIVVCPIALVLMSDPPASAGPTRTAGSAPSGTVSWYRPSTKTAADYCNNNGVLPVASTMMESGGIVMQLPPASVYKGKITSVVGGGGHYYGNADADAVVTLDSGKTMNVRLTQSQLTIALSALERGTSVEFASRVNQATCTGPATLEYLKL